MDAIESLARQRGRVVLTEELLAVGIDHRGIGREARLGRLVRLIRGAYAVTPFDDDVGILTARAAARRYRLAAVSCEFALALHGCDIPLPDAVHLTGPLPKPPGTPGVVVHASRGPVPITGARGVRVVTGPVAVLGAWSDLAGLGDRRAMVCAAMRAGVARTAHVRALDPGRRRVRGAAELIATCEYVDRGCESPPEIDYLVGVELAHRLPPATRQHWIDLPDGRRRRVDVAYLGARLIIEIDGAHHSDERTSRRDAANDAALVAMGWTVLRFTGRDVMLRPAWVAAQVRAALLAAA